MPNRIIKESICTSDTIETLSWFEEVLFYRLIVNCDDYGRYDARPAIIRGKLFPLKDVTLKQISEAIIKLSTVGIATLYEVDGRPYLQLCTWDKHQVVRAHKSKYPSPTDENAILQASESGCMQMHADVSVIQSNPNRNRKSESESESRGKGENSPTARFEPPSVEEVAAYCRKRGNAVDPQRFVDFYAAKGWMVGKNTMKDWQACVRTWEKRDNAENGAQRSVYSKDLLTGLIEGAMEVV